MKEEYTEEVTQYNSAGSLPPSLAVTCEKVIKFNFKFTRVKSHNSWYLHYLLPIHICCCRVVSRAAAIPLLLLLCCRCSFLRLYFQFWVYCCCFICFYQLICRRSRLWCVLRPLPPPRHSCASSGFLCHFYLFVLFILLTINWSINVIRLRRRFMALLTASFLALSWFRLNWTIGNERSWRSASEIIIWCVLCYQIWEEDGWVKG